MVYEAQIEGIFIDRQFEEPVVMLKEKDGDQRVPIWIQMGEMFSLALHISGDDYKPPRPFAHDLIRTVIKNLQASVQHALITDIIDHIYRAQLHLTSPVTPLELDARPSDAILMALKFDAPIYIDEKVVQKSAELSKNHPPEFLQQRLQKLHPEDFINFVQ